MQTVINGIIVEESNAIFEDSVRKYNKIFESLNICFSAKYAKGRQQAQKIIDSSIGSERIHVLIVDLVGASNERLGLQWVQEFKQSYPDLVIFGTTGKMLNLRTVSTKSTSFDIFVDKTLLTQGLPDYILGVAEKFSAAFCQNLKVRITEDSPIPEVFKGGSKNRELCSIVAQVLFSGDLRPDRISETVDVRLSPLTGGYSGSHVFRMDVTYTDPQIRGVAAVLKVSHPQAAREEELNYNKYVRWLLPYKWRVDLLGTGYAKKWGGVCYSFIAGNAVSYDSVTAALEAGDGDAAEQVIDSIFSPDYQTWYSEKLAEVDEDTDITEYYSASYFRSKSVLDECSNHFNQKAQELLGAIIETSGAIKVGDDLSVPEPSSKLFSVGRGPTRTTVCHGDLNSNNVLGTESGEYIFIDFQNTGRHHVFTDFIVFESSVRLNYREDALEFHEILKFENLISNYDNLIGRNKSLDGLPKIYELISKIRKQAIKNFSSESWENYLFGSTVFSLRLLRIDDFSSDQYMRTLAQLVSGLTKL
ncbi:phosphotransferase [Phaeobacter marinintestinus]|uniref:phosphotransferase n=1 Tax=Falsiphaeobacter marinintestinus TaxID=1492905 RepID=UPI0011B35BE4|nr:phosphotransferase [Phaeobacter marinintestinus]